jgi:hypothetical protein
MFAAKDRPVRHAAVPRRPIAFATFPLASSSEFPPPASTPEQRKMNALCFDTLTKAIIYLTHQAAFANLGP